LGIGDWGLGIAIPNPQSPIPIIRIIIRSDKEKIKIMNI